MIFIVIEVLKDSIDELFYDATSIDSLLLKALLVEEDNFVLFAEVAVHASLIGVLELISSTNLDNEILVDLILKE